MSNVVVEIKNKFQYENGKLIYKDHHFKTFKGKEAGGIYVCTHAPFKTFRRVRVGVNFVPAHHAVWMIFNGYIPKNTRINHLNGDTLDNRIENLELADAISS